MIRQKLAYYVCLVAQNFLLLVPFLATENMPRQLRIVDRAGGSSWQSYRIIATRLVVHLFALCIIRVTYKPCSERPTQLNSTQLNWQLGWVELSCKSVQSALTTQLNSTENRSVFRQSRNSGHFQNWLSWVELSRALWTRRKLLKTGRDPVCSVWPTVACHDSEFSAYPTL